ncbi:class I SAM-dependent methyltransferase [Alteraurantiacibacter palmitatis]|uniref:Class I SAM-dependent methyltransferase n=1 Tax=Alteraurantiacibacter palmitatis TaxID=2054628 RepID=A0ABV7E4W1_9SPHN
MDKSDWQGGQGQTWAAEWRRTDRSFTAVTEKLLQRLRGLAFAQVLDIGCGAGELALAVARGRAPVRVIGVDISPQLVGAARDRGANLANASFELADAAQWEAPQGFAPQLLMSRHGVMFFEDPVAAFRHLAALADSGAHLLFSCFRSPAENPFFADIARLLPQPLPPAPPEAPGPFAFADRARVAGILQTAGWEAVAIDPFDFPMIVGAGDDPVSDAVDYFANIGPAAKAAQAMTDEERAAFFNRVGQLARANLADGLVAMPAAGWIVSARKA